MKVKAVITKFNQRRLCAVTPRGEPQGEYDPRQVYWVERAEDLYGEHAAPNPGCILEAEDWREGTPV